MLGRKRALAASICLLLAYPLAYLLAEGVTLQCKDEEHQKLLNAFWSDPINNWPMRLEQRVRALGLLGEQCYIANVREGDGFVRLGYLDPSLIGRVVMDPDNGSQPQPVRWSAAVNSGLPCVPTCSAAARRNCSSLANASSCPVTCPLPVGHHNTTPRW